MRSTHIFSGKKLFERSICLIVLLIFFSNIIIPVGTPTTNSSPLRAEPKEKELSELPMARSYQEPSSRSRASGMITSMGKSTYMAREIHRIHGSSLAGGIGYGNFDSDAYQELIVIGGSQNGRVTLIDYNETTSDFDSEILWWDPDGGLVDIAVGELDSAHPGPEIIVGGFSGNLSLLYYNEGSGTTNVTIWNTSRQNENTFKLNHIFGLAIGDIDARYPGNEIAVADAATMNVYILINTGTAWTSLEVPLADMPRNVYIGDFDRAYPGDELLVLCVNGLVYRVAFDTDQGQWSALEVFKDVNAGMSAVIDDFNSSHPGSEVVIAGLSWNTTLIWGSGSTWFNKTLWHANGALEGMAYGDFDKLHDGKELCITGYSNTAVMLYETGSGWYNEMIFYDPDPLQTELNGALVVDFSGPNNLTDLLIIGFTGKVWILTFVPPDFELTVLVPSNTVRAGEFATFRLDLEIYSSYSSDVVLDLTGLPPECTYDLSRSILAPKHVGDDGGTDTSNSVLTVYTSSDTPPGTYNLTITGTSLDDDRKSMINLTLTITPIPPPQNFRLKVTPEIVNLNLSSDERFARFTVGIIPENMFNDPVTLYLDEKTINTLKLYDGINYTITWDVIYPGDYADINISISDPEAFDFGDDDPGQIKLTLIVRGKNAAQGLDQSVGFTLNILSTEDRDVDDRDEKELLHSDDRIAIGVIVVIIFILVFILIHKRNDKYGQK